MAISLRRFFRRSQPPAEQAPGPPPRAPTTEEQREQLARLEELRDQGLLTEGEFAEQRAWILGR